MLGIHIEKGNTKGWFGQSIASALFSIVVLVLLAGGIAGGIFAAVNAGRETNVSQPPAPATPNAPTVEPTTPTQTPNGVEVKGAVTTTVLIQNALKGKYKEGDKITVAGTVMKTTYVQGWQWVKLEGEDAVVRIWIVEAEIGPKYQKNGARYIVKTDFVFPDDPSYANLMLEPMEEATSMKFLERLKKMQGEEIIVSGEFEEIDIPYVVLTNCILVETP